MKKTAVLVMVLLTVLYGAISVRAEEGQTKSWYCVRNKEHKQPIADADMRFVEQYDGIYVDHTHGDDSDDKVIYLTFDVGYENGNVERILDILREKDVKATFFILSNVIESNPDLICRMTDDGHDVGNHTCTHKDLTRVSDEELHRQITALEAQYVSLTGKPMAKLFRPPEGKFNEHVMRQVQGLGYRTVFWSFAYADWDNARQPSATQAKEKILENLHNGAILLLHPTSATNAQILGDVINQITAMGYRFGRIGDIPAS